MSRDGEVPGHAGRHSAGEKKDSTRGLSPAGAVLETVLFVGQEEQSSLTATMDMEGYWGMLTLHW